MSPRAPSGTRTRSPRWRAGTRRHKHAVRQQRHTTQWERSGRWWR